MPIAAKHNRLAVGHKSGDWTVVYYEPIEPNEPTDLTTPHHAPEIGLYSQSRGDPRPNDPMPGQVAWESLLGIEHTESVVKKERERLQKMLLWDAWRYTVAEDPMDIEIIKMQLQETTKQRALLMELDLVRKTKSNNIKRNRQRRERRRQRMLELGLPAESVEEDDDEEDSGLGSGGEGGEDNEEGSMPPPPPPRRYGPNGTPGGLRLSQTPRFRTHRGSSGAEVDDDDFVETVRTGSSGSVSRSRGQASARASGSKRRRREGSGTQNSHRRTESRNNYNDMFVSSTTSQNDVDDVDGRRENPLVRGVNGEFQNEEDAVAEAVRRSVMPEDDAVAEAVRRSVMPGEDAVADAVRRSEMPEELRNIEGFDDGLDDESFGR
jgi:hypothetical protein